MVVGIVVVGVVGAVVVVIVELVVAVVAVVAGAVLVDRATVLLTGEVEPGSVAGLHPTTSTATSTIDRRFTPARMPAAAV